MNYELDYSPGFQRRFKKLEKQTRLRIHKALQTLRGNPYNHPHVKRMKDRYYHKLPMYRLRVGNYRITYTILNQVLLILVVNVFRKRRDSDYR